MKHPLTSKERRGLVAVAAAALLCISSAFIFRNCSSHHYNSKGDSTGIVLEKDSLNSSNHSNNSKFSNHRSNRSDKSNKSYRSKNSNKKKGAKKEKTPKTYPTRDPLSEPCD